MLLVIALLVVQILSQCTFDCAAGSYFVDCSSGCVECPKGHYCPGTPPVSLPCPVGEYLDSVGATMLSDCDPCGAGNYTTTLGTVECSPCPLGFRCPDPDSKTRCLAGTFTLSPGQTTCDPCPAGSFCPASLASSTPPECPPGTFSGPSEASCTPCDEGDYQVDSNSISCDECPAGSKCPVVTAGPVACPKGTFSDAAATSCSSCPAGKYADSTGTPTQCSNCPAGYYCPIASESPVECPRGTKNDGALDAKSACDVCGSGYYQNETGQVDCLDCPAGSKCPVPGHSPQECPEGSYAPIRSVVCGMCPSGKKCGSDPSVLPQDCDPGTFSPGDRLVVDCDACPDGMYENVGGASVCLQCPDGASCATKSALPDTCDPGEYSPFAQAGCLPCPNGTYSAAGAAGCLDCPPGKECSDPTVAASCPLGTFSIGRAVACTSCPPGTVSAADRKSCDLCALGSYCNGTYEVPCPDGTFASVAGSSACVDCPPGFRCPDKTSVPTLCGFGEFSPAGSDLCVSCPAGKTCIDGTEVDCPSNEYSSDGDIYCHLCPAGQSCATPASTPADCVSGNFSRLGEIDCTTCPAGYGCPDPAVEPVACEPGFWSAGGAQYCSPCAIGYYCPNFTMIAEVPCPNGTFTVSLASLFCEECQPGHWCSSVSQTRCLTGEYSGSGEMSCSVSPSGSYLPSPTAVPIACSNGTYAAPGQLRCYDCPKGYSCNRSAVTLCLGGSYSGGNQESCTQCPEGFYCPAGASEPILCDRGSWSVAGSDVCSTCAGGFFCPQGSASPNAIECPIGYYCLPGTNTPILCPAGRQGNSTGASSISEGCDPCPAGYYCPPGTVNLTKSLICPTGHYCPAKTTYSTEFPCLAGTYNPTRGSSDAVDCLQCPAGYYCYAGASDYHLNRCPPGYYCEAGSQVRDGTPCPAGTFNSREGLTIDTECDECPAGHYCPLTSVNPIPCGVGTRRATPGATVGPCVACPAGTSCPFVGTVDPEPESCTPGHYCIAGTSDQGTECPDGSFTNRRDVTQVGDCEVCWEGYACSLGTGGLRKPPLPCYPGHYCPGAPQPGDAVGVTLWGGYTGPFTVTPQDNDCPAGSYSNSTSLTAAEECTPCPPGQYCTGGLTRPDGVCSAGHYCPERSSSPTEEDCPDGTYSPNLALGYIHECITCPAGYYCQSTDTSPTECPVGTYYPEEGGVGPGPTFDDADLECIRCPAGHWCGIAEIEPLVCGVGYYSDHTESFCSTCVVGHYCPDNTTTLTNMTNVYICEAGVWCPSGMDRLPDLHHDACPVGKYCPEATPTIDDCPAGTYSPITGLKDPTECTLCPRGFYCSGGLAAPDGLCDIGHYCPNGSSVATEYQCPSGTYRHWLGADSVEGCAVCPNGHYCPIGTSDPLDCPRGMYCVINSTSPEPCPVGTYGNSTNLKAVEFCTACPAGRFCDGSTPTEPTGLCQAGYYCTGGAHTATPSGPPQGGLCPRGGYCEIGSTLPSACAAGSFNNNTGGQNQSSCEACLPGFYCGGSSNPYPTDLCLAGFYCTGGASTPVQNSCPPGSFCPAGSDSAQACLPGTYNLAENQTVCSSCPTGFYCPNPGMMTFADYPCPVGQYCGPGVSTPSDCPNGTFSNMTELKRSDQCMPCLPGEYCGSPGLDSPTGDCDSGFFCVGGSAVSDPTDGIVGNVCRVGHYCPTGTYRPVPCPPGTFLNVTGGSLADDCLACPPGMYCQDSGLEDPTDMCDAGYYCSNASYSRAPIDDIVGNACPLGHYCPIGSSSPRPCPEGTFSSRNTRSHCDDCPAGFFCNGTTIFPYPCPPGGYCPARTNSTIPECPLGTFSSRSGLREASDCSLCSGGRACTTLGLTSPNADCEAGIYCEAGALDPDGSLCGYPGAFSDQCPPGSYCIEGSSRPADCPVGTFTGATGNEQLSDCDNCTAGWYCETTGLSSETGQCSEGYYCISRAEVATPTDGVTGNICSTGNSCPVGSFEETPCVAGTYADRLGMSSCSVCPAGYYCGNMTTEPVFCDAGNYCPEGTPTQPSCPSGSFSSALGLSNVTQCQLCLGGKICNDTGLTSPPYDCPEGWYCLRGATDGGTVGVLGGTSLICPNGHYCPTGSVVPQPCPPGTFRNDTGGIGIDDCQACLPGHYCDLAGLDDVAGECNPKFYCSLGALVPNPTDNNVTGDVCSPGHYCPAGSSAPVPCPAATYSNSTMKSSCDYCPPSYYCPPNSAFPLLCPAGKFCENATSVPTPCPAGSLSPTLGLSRAEDCSLCPPGLVCSTSGLQANDSLCGAGFLCVMGAVFPNGSWGVLGGSGGPCPPGRYCPEGTPDPALCPIGTMRNTSGGAVVGDCWDCSSGQFCSQPGLSYPDGPCDAGYYCPSGSSSPKAVICPKGYFCPSASSAPTPCVDGTYQDVDGSSECKQCPVGFQCLNMAVVPEICPQMFYCDDGLPHYCPNGTYGIHEGYTNSLDCLLCPPGKYCFMGEIQGDCYSGHICHFGNSEPDPISEGRRGQVCPVGHYCPQGATSPVPCPNSVSSMTGATNVSSCHVCRIGYYCVSGMVQEFPCRVGYYCDQNATGLGVDPIPCPVGTINPVQLGTNLSVCVPCPEGYFCPVEAMPASNLICPPGKFCPSGSSSPQPCPAGTFRNETGGVSVASCADCVAGHYCNESSHAPTECSEGTVCPPASLNETDCPPGYFCLKRSGSPTDCPAGYYCPLRSALPTLCEGAVYCLQNSDAPTPCPDGYTGNSETVYKVSLEFSCLSCPPGTYSQISTALRCSNCSAGYVCLAGATTPTPLDIVTERGYICPKGHYCPNATGEPLPCPQGNFSRFEGMSECPPCPVNAYQESGGKDHCKPCGRSSYSLGGASTCICNGTNRTFQFSDGFCICAEGYAYYDGDDLASNQDSAEPCNEIIFQRCMAGERRTIRGNCVADSPLFCETEVCGGLGVFDASLGVCSCESWLQDENQICDEDCRAAQRRIRLNPDLNIVEIYESDTGTILSTFDYRSISAGTLDCRRSSCGLEVVRLGSDFLGVYDPPEEYLIAMLSENGTSTVDVDYSRRSVLALEDTLKVMRQPLVCVRVGEGVLFDLREGAGYPVFLRDTLVNRLESDVMLDFGHFRKLETYEAGGHNSQLNVATFSYVFHEPGVFTFGMSGDPNKVMVIRVMPEQTLCPDDASFKPMTSQNLVWLGVSKRPETEMFLTPDWILIAVLVVGFFGFIVSGVGAIHYFRTSTFLFALSNARPHLPSELESIVTANLKKRDEEKKKGMLDLDGFDVGLFFRKMSDHEREMGDAFDKYMKDLLASFEEISQDTDMLKDLIMGQPESAQVCVLLNVKQNVENLQRLVKDLENSEDYYDKDSLDGIFGELEEQMSSLEMTKMKDVNKKMFEARDLEKLESYTGVEERLKATTLSQFDSYLQRLSEIRAKMDKAIADGSPRIVRSELVSVFSDVVNRAIKDLGRKLNGVNQLRIKMNELVAAVHANVGGVTLSSGIGQLLNKFLVDILEELFRKYGLFKEEDLEMTYLMELEDDGLDLDGHLGLVGDGVEEQANKMKGILRIQQSREMHKVNEELKEEVEQDRDDFVDKFETVKRVQVDRMHDQIQNIQNDPELSEDEKRRIIESLKSDISLFEKRVDQERENQMKQLESLLRQKLERKKRLLGKVHKNEAGILHRQVKLDQDFSRRLTDVDDREADFSSKEAMIMRKKQILEENDSKMKGQEELDRKNTEVLVGQIEEESRKIDVEAENAVNEIVARALKRSATKKIRLRGLSDVERERVIREHQDNVSSLKTALDRTFDQFNSSLQTRLEERREKLRLRQEEKSRFEQERQVLRQEREIGKMDELMTNMKEEDTSAQEERVEELKQSMEREAEALVHQKHEDEERLEIQIQGFEEQKNEEISASLAALEQEKQIEIDALRQKMETKLGNISAEDDSERKKLVGEFNTQLRQYEESYEIQKQRQQERVMHLVEDRRRKLQEKLKKKQELREVRLLEEMDRKLDDVVEESDGLLETTSVEEESIVEIKEEDAIAIQKLKAQHDEEMARIREEIEEKKKRIVEQFNRELDRDMKQNQERFLKIKTQKAASLKQDFADRLRETSGDTDRREILAEYKHQVSSLNSAIRNDMDAHRRQLQQRIQRKRDEMMQKSLEILEGIKKQQLEDEEQARQQRQLEEERTLMISLIRTKKIGSVEDAIRTIVVPRQRRQVEEWNARASEIEDKKWFLRKRVELKQRHLSERDRLKVDLSKYEEVLRRDVDVKKKLEDEMSSFQDRLTQERKQLLLDLAAKKEREKLEIEQKMQEIQAQRRRQMEEIHSAVFDDVDDVKKAKMLDELLADEIQPQEVLTKKVSAQETQQKLLDEHEHAVLTLKAAFEDEYDRQMQVLEEKIASKLEAAQLKKEEEERSRNLIMNIGMTGADWGQFGRAFFGLQKAKKRLRRASEKFAGARKVRDFVRHAFQHIGNIEFFLSSRHIRPYGVPAGVSSKSTGSAARVRVPATPRNLGTPRSGPRSTELPFIPPKYLPLYQFGKHLIQLLGDEFAFLGFSMVLASQIRQSPSHRHDAFREHFEWTGRTLLVKVDPNRISPGRFLLILVHCCAHIQTQERQFIDTNPAFQRNFYRMMMFVYEQYFGAYVQS